MPPKGGKRAKREPVEAVEDEKEAEAGDEEFPVHALDGYQVPLVCRSSDEYYSVMGVLFWSHYNSLEAGIMRFFDTEEACVLRLVHSEFRDAVSATPWHDLRTVIKGSVASWRECFGLRAQAASVCGRRDLVDADFVHFRGLAALDMGDSSGFSDTAYANLRGISCLNVYRCAISVEAIFHLKGVQEIIMAECDLAATTAAFECLQGARTMIHSSVRNKIHAAIAAGDVPECRRLLATRASGSASWLYAGVDFNDAAAPSTPDKTIASACLELLQVGIDAESAGIILEAAIAICGFIRVRTEATTACCIKIGVVAALVSALKISVCWVDINTCANLCVALYYLATTDGGGRACMAAHAISTLVPLLKFHLRSSFASEYMCRALGNMSLSEAGTKACISSGGVPQIVAALEMHAMWKGVCTEASRALNTISRFADGKAACLAADAVPHLIAAYKRHPLARELAKEALENLGF